MLENEGRTALCKTQAEKLTWTCCPQVWSASYIDFHLLVDTVVHDQAVRQAYAMRLHRMTGDICVVSNIGVVEVCDSFLARWSSQIVGIDGCEAIHDEIRGCNQERRVRKGD
jgi:pyoverdine/dityrosine biosynthesis protein Dit1